jgi:hypothetical protein
MNSVIERRNLKMRLITEKTQYQEALDYLVRKDATHKSDSVANILKVRGISPENATKEDIRSLVGHDITSIQCTECNKTVKSAVLLTATDPYEVARVCPDCLQKSLDLVKKEKDHAQNP